MDKIKNNIYYIAFSLLVIIAMLEKSQLIILPNIIIQISYVVISILFLIKLIFDKPKLKEIIIYLLLFIIMFYLYYITRNKFFIINLFAFITIKNVDIKKIIIIDLIIKLTILLLHSCFYLYDYIFNYDKIVDLIHISEKGTSLYMYFINPNYVSYYVFIIIFDYFLLQEKITLKQIIISSIAILLVFIVTKTRTAAIMYIFLLIFNLLKNKKVINILFYGSYPFLTLISTYLLVFSLHTPLYYKLNSLLSGRFGYPRLAFEEVGISLIPTSNSMSVYSKYVVDNFFDRCLIYLGIITLIIYAIPIFITPKSGYEKEKKFITVCIIYLFFESVLINISMSIFILLIADIFYNRKKEV